MEIELPENEYEYHTENGKTIAKCTLRHICLHTIGLILDGRGNKGRLYTRHGKKFYKPYRNYFSGNNKELDRLVDAGLMEMISENVHGIEDYRTYWFNRKGLDWLGDQLGIVIRSEVE